VTEPTSLSLTAFAWVHKRDGRLVPFEADKISRGLFATSESLGHPDAFMARELTDGILHFLAAEARGTTPTTAQIADLVIKVVRELGQPALAEAFAEGQARKAESGKQGEEDHRRSVCWPEDRPSWGAASTFPSPVPTSLGPAPEQLAYWVENLPSPGALTWRAAHACLANYSLRKIFSRDIVAAQFDGFLTLTGVHAPLELAGCVLANPRLGDDGILQAVEEARSLTGMLLAVDGPEYLLARQPAPAVGDFARSLRTALRFTQLQVVLNLNTALPPPWAENLADGPLFAGPGAPAVAGPETVRELLDELVERFLSRGALGENGRVDWHLSEHDFAPNAAARLLGLARRALEGAPLAFVFDRPNRTIALAEGLDRQHPSLLLWVGLHLPRLLQLGEAGKDATVFLRKLGSLARLTLSAALQKRDYLRRQAQRQPNLTRGFLLDRARLVVVPVGLDTAVQAFVGRGLCGGGTGLELAQQIVRRLRDVLREDAQAHLLETSIDSFPDVRLATSHSPEKEEGLPTSDFAAGLTCWDAGASPQTQLRMAGPLHAAAGAGTATVLLTEEQLPTAEAVVQWLHSAWRQSDLVRVRFLRIVHPERQLTAPWETVG
jgi:hypothetical protein